MEDVCLLGPKKVLTHGFEYHNGSLHLSPTQKNYNQMLIIAHVLLRSPVSVSFFVTIKEINFCKQ